MSWRSSFHRVWRLGFFRVWFVFGVLWFAGTSIWVWSNAEGPRFTPSPSGAAPRSTTWRLELLHGEIHEIPRSAQGPFAAVTFWNIKGWLEVSVIPPAVLLLVGGWLAGAFRGSRTGIGAPE